MKISFSLLGRCSWLRSLLVAFAVMSAVQVAHGQEEDAPRELSEVEARLKADPDSLRLLSAAGDAALFAGKAAQAVAHFERMIQLDPAQDAPHWRLGIAYYLNQQYAESARQFAKYHAYDGHDRENGVWKFLGDAKLHGLKRAQTEMLKYTEFDREPFPTLYDLYAGKMSVAEFEADLEKRGVLERPRVKFFARYYAGLYEELQRHPEAAIAKVKEAVELYTPATAEGGGPGYMWRVARVHLAQLQR